MSKKGPLNLEAVRELWIVKIGLDHGIGHLASMSPQKNERLLPSKGGNEWATSASLAMLTTRRRIDTGGRGGNRHPRQATKQP